MPPLWHVVHACIACGIPPGMPAAGLGVALLQGRGGTTREEAFQR